MWAYVRAALLVGVVGALLLSGGDASADPGLTRRVSVDSAASQGNGSSEYAAISADGSYVAFHSGATNLVLGDTNGRDDVFVYHRQTAVTQRVSLSSADAQGNSDSLHPALSNDGRYVAFDSNASNLVSSDTNVRVDVFVRDRQTNTTERVSLSSGGVEGNDTSWYPAISGDGRFVAFQSFASNLVSGDSNNVEDIFVRDRQTATTTRVSLATDGTQGNGGSWDVAISATGRYVAFASDASTLVAGDTNGFGDVFVRDRDTDGDGIFDEAGSVSTTRVSVSGAGAQSNGESYYAAISAEGRYVAFSSGASNLVTGDTNVSCDTDGDTQYDDNCPDVFVRDRQAPTATVRVSLDSGGGEANADSYDPAISADGRYVAFWSFANDLVSGDTNAFCDTDGDDQYDDNCPDIFMRDRDAEEDGTFDEAGEVSTVRVSVSSFGVEANGESLDAAISGDGNQVAFNSSAWNLAPGDSNGVADVFVHDQRGSVGGVAELPGIASDSGRPEIDRTVLAGVAAVALALALAIGALYGVRRIGRAKASAGNTHRW